MSNIEEYNRITNASTSNRFERWKKYRGEITKTIIKLLHDKGSSPLDILVLGIGNADDFDLSVIAPFANRLTLTDVDTNALSELVHKYKLDPAKTTLLPMEYTGLHDFEPWNKMINHLLTIHTEKEIEDLVLTIREKLESYDFSNNIPGKYDVIIVTPVYTQLLYVQLMTEITMLNSLDYPTKLTEHLRSEFLNIMPACISRFNTSLVNLLNETGQAIVLSDIFESETNTPVSTILHQSIRSKSAMDEYYDRYHEKYGFGLGDFGLYDLSLSLDEKKHYWFFWPFSEEKEIYVKLVEYHFRGGQE